MSQMHFNLQSALDNAARARSPEQPITQLLAGLASYFAPSATANQFDSKGLLENLRSALGATDAHQFSGVENGPRSAKPLPEELIGKERSTLELTKSSSGEEVVVGGTDANKFGGVGNILRRAKPLPEELIGTERSTLELAKRTSGEEMVVGGTDAHKFGGVGSIHKRNEPSLDGVKQETYDQAASDLLSSLKAFLKTGPDNPSVSTLRQELQGILSAVNDGGLDSAKLLASLHEAVRKSA